MGALPSDASDHSRSPTFLHVDEKLAHEVIKPKHSQGLTLIARVWCEESQVGSWS